MKLKIIEEDWQNLGHAHLIQRYEQPMKIGLRKEWRWRTALCERSLRWLLVRDTDDCFFLYVKDKIDQRVTFVLLFLYFDRDWGCKEKSVNDFQEWVKCYKQVEILDVCPMKVSSRVTAGSWPAYIATQRRRRIKKEGITRQIGFQNQGWGNGERGNTWTDT